MTKQKNKHKEELLKLISHHSKAVHLKPHDLVSNRREGVINPASSDASSFGGEIIEQALKDFPHDVFLGLKWYRADPLPLVVQAVESTGLDIKFVDSEIPVDNRARVAVAPSPNKEAVECVPGVITSSNCRDFLTVPKRVPRIKHFISKAKCLDGGWSWKRASLMQNSTCALFSASSKSIDPRNVLQGKVGNCGFCSGIASIAAGFPCVIQDAFGENSQLSLSKYGAVSILLYPRGQPRYLLMDDFILCKNERDCDGNGRKTASPSMHSLLTKDVWVRLLEKAFVKVQGSYASLDGFYKYNSLYRHPARAMQLLTGATLALEVHYSTSDEEVVRKILLLTQGNYARVVHCRKKLEGLIPNHGYSLLWIGEGGGEHWVCLRNPHGQGSYKGRGFDGSLICSSKERETPPECLTVCCNTGRVVWKQESSECHSAFALQNCHHDNGIFFMELSKFVECFPITTIVGPIDKMDIDEVGNECIDVFTRNSQRDCLHEVHRGGLRHLSEILASSKLP